jgi:ABC-2 type transport system ATP-binding protein
MNTAHAERPKEPALSIQDLRASYGGRSVLTGLNLEMGLGEWFAVLGPNGSGKTTLLSCIAGILEPSAGDITLCGLPLRKAPQAAKRLLGFACSPEQVPGLLTGYQCLQVYAAAKDLQSIDQDVLELADAFEISSRLLEFVHTYSLGMRQKLAILMALLGEPKLIVLDESFNGLDPASGLLLKKYLRTRVDSGRSSVMLATHSLDIVERYADRAALLLDGAFICEWNSAEIARLRESDEGLEGAVASRGRP